MSDTDAPKNKGGRPRKVITDSHLRQIEVLAGFGLTQAAVAHVIGISPDTLYRNKQLRPEVLRALERGKAKAEEVIGEALYLKAKSGDVRAIVWWEKTRAGRRDATDVTTMGQPVTTHITYRIENSGGELVEDGF